MFLSPLRARTAGAPSLAFSGHRGCNGDATAAAGSRLVRVVRDAAVVLLVLAAAGVASGAPQEEEEGVGQEPPPGRKSVVEDTAKFLAGGALGLCAHETGHLVFDYAFGADPGIKKVTFGPLPFFAITHHDVSPRQEFVIASAGFWVQHLGNEVILTRRPGLRAEHAPLTKGIFAFNVLASMAYAGGAFAHAGPAERDTRSMAATLGVDEAAVGAMLLVPAVLDTVRYIRPGARWPVWASRAAKVAMVLLVFKTPRG